MPSSTVEQGLLEKGVSAFELFTTVGLCSSRSEARRLINQKGGYVNGEPINSFDEVINLSHLKDGRIILRSGKKKYHQIMVK